MKQNFKGYFNYLIVCMACFILSVLYLIIYNLTNNVQERGDGLIATFSEGMEGLGIAIMSSLIVFAAFISLIWMIIYLVNIIIVKD